jgi:hypothetical protein
MLDVPEMIGVRLSKRLAMASEDIRHLQSWSHGPRSVRWHDLQAEPIERARRDQRDRSFNCRESGFGQSQIDSAPVNSDSRLGRASLTRGNGGGSHIRGKSIVETALAGWGGRIRTGKCHFDGRLLKSCCA